jgi:hypothetical protein
MISARILWPDRIFGTHTGRLRSPSAESRGGCPHAVPPTPSPSRRQWAAPILLASVGTENSIRLVSSWMMDMQAVPIYLNL